MKIILILASFLIIQNSSAQKLGIERIIDLGEGKKLILSWERMREKDWLLIKSFDYNSCNNRLGTKTSKTNLIKEIQEIQKAVDSIYPNVFYDKDGNKLLSKRLILCFKNNTDILKSLRIFVEKNSYREEELEKLLSDNRYYILRNRIQEIFKGLIMSDHDAGAEDCSIMLP